MAARIVAFFITAALCGNSSTAEGIETNGNRVLVLNPRSQWELDKNAAVRLVEIRKGETARVGYILRAIRKPFGHLETAELAPYDDSAELTDEIRCPAGFECRTTVLPQILTDSTRIEYAIEITNKRIGRGQVAILSNTAVLLERETQIERRAHSLLLISTGTRRGH